MRVADMLQMDLLARKIFLNLEINQQKSPLTNGENPSVSSLNDTF